MRTLDPAVASRLSTLLAHYLRAFAEMTNDDRADPATVQTDACFAALRLQQRTRWREAGGLVDDIGRCACDALHAWRDGGRHDAGVQNALARHTAAAQALMDALATTAKLQREPA